MTDKKHSEAAAKKEKETPTAKKKVEKPSEEAKGKAKTPKKEAPEAKAPEAKKKESVKAEEPKEEETKQVPKKAESPKEAEKPEEKPEKAKSGAAGAKKKKPVAEKTQEKKPVKEKKEKPVEKITTILKETPEKALLTKKKKKPRFNRAGSDVLARVKDVWRRGDGIDSKKHLRKKGKGAVPRIGYGNPEEIRGLHPTGFQPVTVYTPKELEAVDAKKQAVIIAGSVGRNKRNDIIKQANKLEIMILNPRKGETQ